MQRGTQIFVGLFASLVSMTVAHAEDVMLEPLLRGGGCQPPTNSYYVGVSWLGDLARADGELPYAFTPDTPWNLQLPNEFTLTNPQSPPQNVRITAPGPDTSGELAVGVIQVLRARSDGTLNYSYEEINGPESPVVGVVAKYWVVYTHNLNAASRAAMDMPFANELVEGFNLIQGSASIRGDVGCAETATVVDSRTPLIMQDNAHTHSVCWGSY